jgi:hypothetical protein
MYHRRIKMYRIKEDYAKSLILIEIKGKMERKEVESFANELSDIFDRYPLKSMSVISCNERMDPLSQENARIMKAVTQECVLKANKIAVVHKRTVTKMQLKRLEKEVKEDGHHGVPIMRFSTREEAQDYIGKSK